MPKVKLKRFTSYNGNAYYAGVYNDYELPERLTSDPNLVEQVELNADVATSEYSTAINEQVVKITTQEETQKQASFDPEKPAIVNDHPIAINTATADEILTLKGVTMANATSIISLREESPFLNAEDLDKRVPLKKGQKWKSFDQLNYAQSN